MILLDPKEDGTEDECYLSRKSPNFQLIIIDRERKYGPVAREYLAMKKKPFYHPEHWYEMSACKYDLKKRCAVEPMRKDYMELNDGEYLFLLTRILIFGSSYRYIHLLDERPELARRIIEKLFGCVENLRKDGLGYHVTFDEVFENAKEIMQLKDYYFPGNPNSSMIFF